MMVEGNYYEVSGEDIVKEACRLLYEDNDLLGALGYLNRFFPIDDNGCTHIAILDGTLILRGTARPEGVSSLYLSHGESSNKFTKWLKYIKDATPKRYSRIAYFDMETKTVAEVKEVVDSAIQR